MVRRERLTKIINILSEIYSEDFIMCKTPQELEEIFYRLISTDKPITKKYLENKYDKRSYKRANNKILKAEQL